MNVYNKVIIQLQNHNKSIEELNLKIANLDENKINDQVSKCINERINNIPKINLPTEDRGNSKDFTNEIKEIKDDIIMIKKQIGDLVVIIESLMKMNK